jgi:hypothetical protein
LIFFQKEGLWVNPKNIVDIIKDDPKDNRFLECAQEAIADFLITGNKKHFSNLNKFKDTLIVSPHEFIFQITPSIFKRLN